jgi:hypothetical protein
MISAIVSGNTGSVSVSFTIIDKLLQINMKLQMIVKIGGIVYSDLLSVTCKVMGIIN